MIAGQAADRRGTAFPFFVGLAFFAGGLCLGGLAPTMGVLVVARVLQGFGAGAIQPNLLALRQPHFMWLCHEAGIRVNAWTVDDVDDVTRLTELGVDAIITNFPDRARQVLRAQRH